MENEEYDTIDLLEVLNAVRQHLAILILCTLAAAVVGFAVSQFAMTPQYESSALMIVNTRQDTTSNVTSDQINSATKLVSTYSIIIKSDTVLQQVINDLGLSLTYGELKDRVTVDAVDDTQVMKITVRSNNPEWAQQVCNKITEVSPDAILEAVEGYFSGTCPYGTGFPQRPEEYRSGWYGRVGTLPGCYLPAGFAGQ